MSERLWSDRRIAERIEQDLTRKRIPYTVLPSRVMEAACEIRDDYEARIAELERQLEQAVDVVEDTSMESWVSGEKAAEQRSEWGHGEWTDALPYLYADVCLRAERNMETTGTVSGAHWNAFRQFLEERGLLEEAEQELQRSREATE